MIENLRVHYEGLTDEEILKAQEQVEYVLYDKNSGEITQAGNMDRLAFERFIPHNPDLEKIIVPPDHVWKLRGEFIDHDGGGKHMFKVEVSNITEKTEHKTKIEERKLPHDKTNAEINTAKEQQP